MMCSSSSSSAQSKLVIRCAKGIFVGGRVLEGTRLSRLQWDGAPEIPSRTGQCKLADVLQLARRALTWQRGSSRALSQQKRETLP